MSTAIYTPLSSRLTTVKEEAQSELAKLSRSSRVLHTIAKPLHLSPSTILLIPLLLLSLVLLVNPKNIAPGLSSVLAFLPAIASLRHLGRSDSASKVARTKFLLDYWMCVGTSFVIEQLLPFGAIGRIVPIWWLVKGMAGIMVCMSIDDGGEGGRRRLRGLTLNTTKSIPAATLIDPEPSPSPISNTISALSSGVPPSDWSGDDSHSPTSSSGRYNSPRLPHVSNSDTGVSSTDSAPSTDQTDAGSPLFTPPIPPSPRDQLDAFLDSTVPLSPESDRGNAFPSSAPTGGFIPRSLIRADTLPLGAKSPDTSAGGADSDSDGGLSPEFIFDGLLPDSAPLSRLPRDADAIDGGPQMKDKGGQGKGELRTNMTLDDLLAMEREEVGE